MGYRYEWVEEPWILRVNYSGRLMHDDIEAVMEYCLKLVDQHPTNFLIDVTEVTGFDPNVMKSRSVVIFTRKPNTKWFAVVGLDMSIVKLGVAVLGRFASIKQFSSIEDGIKFLKEMTDHQKREAGQPEGT